MACFAWRFLVLMGPVWRGDTRQTWSCRTEPEIDSHFDQRDLLRGVTPEGNDR
jgi:hypothetical protein